MRLRHGIIFLALLLPLVTFAEGAPEQGKYIFDHLGFEDGLQGSHIYSVMESADGAMWFSSKNSVFRYNGQVIAEFPLTVTNNLFSSGSGRTTALFSGEAGNICAFDNKGNIFRYNPATDSFVETFSLSSGWQGDAIILGDVLYDESGQYWLGMNSGLYSMQKNGTVTCAYEGIYVNQISQIDGRLVLCTNTGIRIYNPSDGSCGSLLEGTPVQSAWYDAASGLLWAGTFNNGVKLLNPSSGAITAELESDSHAPVRDIEPVNDTTVIFGIDGKGIFTATRDGRPLERMYRGRNTDGGTLNSNSVYDICVDRWGNLWIGNYTGGVDVIFPASGLVEFIRPSDNTPESLPDAKVNDVLQSKDGHLWFATDNGVSECGSGRRWRHILPGEVVLTLTEDADGNILAGTYGTGVYRIRREKNLSATPLYNMASGTLATDYVYSLLRDSEGNLWIGCLNG
ncbi:MAG: hypothetical protein HUJ91_07620, partial [Bacteroidales bacterium]|nr:hypothetical protein [Bacteroidales bacterium]